MLFALLNTEITKESMNIYISVCIYRVFVYIYMLSVLKCVSVFIV